MYRRTLIFGCKVLIKLLRLVGKNGSALPGLIIERCDPAFLDETLKSTQKKIILITGTNGKTTTTKMVVAALRGTGARVVTNTTGSNMTRGLIAALVEDMTYFGSLKPTDWFVFEMDEAYAPIFTKNISPRALLALNVLRDQLDRYGEIDTTAALIARAAKKSDIFVYNALDPLLVAAAGQSGNKHSISFGVDTSLYSHVANEQSLHGETLVGKKDEETDVTLLSVSDVGDMQQISLKLEDEVYDFVIPVKGFHNAMNAAAVVGLLRAVDAGDMPNGIKAISQMTAPFGRGEKLHLQGKNVTVALVKNPSGFMSNLETFVKQGKPEAIVFVVNDKIADGRDVSWLWDVDFKPFLKKDTHLYTSGIRGYDMALRLKHDNFDVNTTTDITRAIQSIFSSQHQNILIIPTYTALFEVRVALAKYGKVPRIW